MRVLLYDTLLAEIPYRPVPCGAIVQVRGKTYTTMTKATSDCLYVGFQRGSAQFATPSYVLDAVPAIKPGHRFIVRINDTDSYVGVITLDAPLIEGDVVRVSDKPYRVVNWSVGQRIVDELYVEEV